MAMKNLETGKDKIQKICDAIRKETLEPAKQEAREIIENAHLQASEIVQEAKEAAAAMKKEALNEIAERQKVFESSLNLACRQGIESLKQKIERDLFAKELTELVDKEMVRPEIIAELIQSFMRSLEDQGIEEDFEVLIPKSISPRSINGLLAQGILDRLKKHSVELGDFHGGVKIRMKGRDITIDISEEVVRELIANYIRRDLRDLVFKV
jgi:V/A-type H+-transporting ATPase subunit E